MRSPRETFGPYVILGHTLDDILVRCDELRTPVPIPIALAICDHLLAALDDAHRQHGAIGQLDARGDLFAVGVTAHGLLANQPVPPAIEQVVMTALASDPEQRWQSASAMRHALAGVTAWLDMQLGPLQLQQWLDSIFAAAAPPGPARPLAALLSETGQTAALGGSQPRLATGAEPLWDMDQPTPTPRPRQRLQTPVAPAVVVSVHPKKQAERKEKARRGAVIAASVVVTLALAAAGYVLLA